MPKNKGKGGKNRRRGKNENEGAKRELILKEEGQEYAQVLKMLGNGRLEAMCFDGTKRLAHIRGKLRKRQWINTSDIILVGLRDYQDAKADVIMKYNSDEARRLKNMGHLPESVNVVDGNEVEDDIFFDNESDEDSGDEIAPQPYQPVISSESESDDSDESD
ncbi:Oidioi.mRNA.OKI2018_I69.PAR.g12853.t1.cds [Oikopleura dioica]|uniref:Eukaryotic translation initiation factor 4C n=1 Tax=Oikopleura dioica TaxID=34765 RepID=A0ABN7S6H0_OIKDI|nr:Oidioi.mRNA.OKI2018_I69.PAR.g12853.t1.cds [Oikopleura dioica]